MLEKRKTLDLRPNLAKPDPNGSQAIHLIKDKNLIGRAQKWWETRFFATIQSQSDKT